MQTIADLVRDSRDREGAVFRPAKRATPYRYREFCTSAWKVGSLLRHYGVRRRARVAIVAGPNAPDSDDEPGWIDESPNALMAFLGAAIDGAIVDLDPPSAVDATVLVAPDAWLDEYTAGPGTKPVAYGGPPDDPRVAHLEREAWSENPNQPPSESSPEDPVLAADELYSHGDLLAASRSVVAAFDLTAEDEVALRAPVTDPGTIVAAVLAPMRVGATVLLGGEEIGTVAVASDQTPEERMIRPDDALP